MQALFSGTFWGSPFLLHPATSYQQGESACSVQPSAERLCCGYAGPVLGEGSSGYFQDSGAWKEELRVLLISCQRVTSSEGWSVICPSVCLSLSHTHSQTWKESVLGLVFGPLSLAPSSAPTAPVGLAGCWSQHGPEDGVKSNPVFPPPPAHCQPPVFTEPFHTLSHLSTGHTTPNYLFTVCLPPRPELCPIYFLISLPSNLSIHSPPVLSTVPSMNMLLWVIYLMITIILMGSVILTFPRTKAPSLASCHTPSK